MKKQTHTTEKVLLTVLVIAFIGLTSVFASAALGNKDSSPATVKVLYSDDDDEFNSDDELDENEPEDVPITGTALERASAAALAYIGEGRVTDTEVGDEEGYYEIEVTLENNREVDVHLDEDYNVISVEY